MYTYNNVSITWLGHDSFLLQSGGKNIYIDPYKLSIPNLPRADFVITTHEHHDHCDPNSINVISSNDTTLLGPEITLNKLEKEVKEKKEVRALNPGDSFDLNGVHFGAIPAYNHHRFRSPGNPFHPKESGHIGPIVTIGGTNIYHAGDTDKIDEMNDLDVDVALLPVSGTYVMDVPEAVEAAKIIRPKVAIPMHVGRGIGKMVHRNQFKEKLSHISAIIVEVLEMESFKTS